MRLIFSTLALVGAQAMALASYAQTPPADSTATRAERKAEGVDASHHFMPGEGDPRPDPTAKLSRAERSAGRKASRAEVARENKGGELPSFNDNYGGK